MTHLIENLDRNIFRPYALCPKRGELSEKLESIGCKCFFMPLYSIKPKYIFKIIPIPIKIRKILKEQKIDIVHPDFTADTFLCGLAKQGVKTKMVWHVRWNEKFAKDRIHGKLADAIIGVSKASGRRFVEYPDIYNKFKVIYNGVDTDVFKPVDDKSKIRKELGMPSDKFVLIFAGVFKEGKGIYDILKAAAILKNKNLAGFSTYFIGSAPNEDIFNHLNEIVRKMEINDIVSFIPQQKEIWKWMQAADALIIPSHENNEGMPRVLYEAVACGTAGVASDVPGVNEAIDESCGVLVKEKSPEDIAEKIEFLMKHPKALKEMQINGRKRALKLFDIEKHTRAVEQVYLDVIRD